MLSNSKKACLHDLNHSGVGQALVLLSNPIQLCSGSKGPAPLRPMVLLPCHLTGQFPRNPSRLALSQHGGLMWIVLPETSLVA